ncbi:MAG TPA: thiosulfate oxidation carrier complex protein SoxZ [Arcobacter sp.]|nr:thiosulfate oxidation carrier complex protein SoxZ [Arcobacter sp.]
MAKKTRIKAKLKKGVVTVKAMASHAMMSYDEAKKKKKSANFITYLVAKVNGQIVYELSSSQFLSKNPYMKFKFTGANKGDKLSLTWTDLSGASQTSTAKIK